MNKEISIIYEYLNLSENLIKKILKKLKNGIIRIYILQKYRDIAYPKDEFFILDISKIKFDFSNINNNLQNMIFSYC